MGKIKFGQAPKSFKKTVKFTTLQGVEKEIVCDYKFRTKTEFGKFRDGLQAKFISEAKAAESVADQPEEKVMLTWEELMKNGVAKDGESLIAMLNGWDLDDPLTPDNAARLADEFPAAALAIVNDYQVACLEGRLGN